MKIGFIGFGGAGYGLAKGLHQTGLTEILFYDRMQQTPPYAQVIRRHAAEIGALPAATAGELLSRVDVVFSCVTGAMAVSVAEEAAPFLAPGKLYADVNTAAPQIKEQVAGIVEKAGAAFVDTAMMGAVPTFLHRVPILASGGGAERFRKCMQPYGMNIRVIGEKPGQASAIKMFRSIFMKGLLSLFLEMLTATHRYGVDETVLGSIAESLDGVPFLETARLQMTKGGVNAERMAHEMEEVIATLEGMGLPSGMSRAAMEKLRWCAGFGLRERFGGELPATLTEVLRAMENPAEGSHA
ncbi:MAG: NAD(P)-binding domain-containing protein [Deltaproteobacteria bacterium]|nr:NAD(P)-binding domain-containing protein [Deltaproteobacteria bacterium]